MHCDEAGAVTDVGVQDKSLSEVDGGAPSMVTVAPDPVAAIAAAEPEVAIALSTWMLLDVDVVVLESVRLAFARMPLEIAFVFKPLARQIYRPEEGELHETVFPALDAADPAVTDTLVKSAVEYENVHWTPEA